MVACAQVEEVPEVDLRAIEAHAEEVAELDGPEGEEIRSQLAWFQRKYPTALDRLAYVRRKMAELARVSRDG